MKKIILSAFLIVSGVLQAQDVMETMARESCECITAKNIDPNALSSEKLELEFGLCVVKSYSAHKEAYDKISKSDISDEDSMRKLGKDVALKMFSICPDMLMALAKDGADDNEETQAESPKIEGQVLEFVTDQFVTIKVKDKNQRIHSFILLDYFDTASLYTDGLIRKKDKVTVSYSEVELFDPKAKEFRYYKVITGLEKK